MKNKQAKDLIKQVGQEYLGEHWEKKLTSIQCSIWEDTILDWNYEAAKEAIKQLFINRPAYRNEFNYKMPDVDILTVYYGEQIVADNKYCPCCQGTGWINYKPDSVRECLHGKPTSDEPCKLFDCRPIKDYPCPFGVQYYNAIKVEFMAKIKKDPDYQLGCTFLKKRDIEGSMADKVEDVPDVEELPETQEETPF